MELGPINKSLPYRFIKTDIEKDSNGFGILMRLNKIFEDWALEHSSVNLHKNYLVDPLPDTLLPYLYDMYDSPPLLVNTVEYMRKLMSGINGVIMYRGTIKGFKNYFGIFSISVIITKVPTTPFLFDEGTFDTDGMLMDSGMDLSSEYTIELTEELDQDGNYHPIEGLEPPALTENKNQLKEVLDYLTPIGMIIKTVKYNGDSLIL